MSYLAMMRHGGSLNARELKVADLKKATDCDPNYSTFWKRRRYGKGRPSQMVLVIKTPPANVGDIRDTGSIPPGLGRSPGGGHGNLLQYSCLENLKDRAAQ